MACKSRVYVNHLHLHIQNLYSYTYIIVVCVCVCVLHLHEVSINICQMDLHNSLNVFGCVDIIYHTFLQIHIN
jgi:hypothetical protein